MALITRFTPLLLLFFLLINVVGCHKKNEITDRSLAQVDSLLNEEELQQALVRLGKIDTVSMNESQTAYYYLLLVQAKYKSFITATTDKEINFAVNYYKNNGDKNRYIRALVYQGGVNEELGNLKKRLIVIIKQKVWQKIQIYIIWVIQK